LEDRDGKRNNSAEVAKATNNISSADPMGVGLKPVTVFQGTAYKVSADEAAQGSPLFNGVDLTGWHYRNQRETELERAERHAVNTLGRRHAPISSPIRNSGTSPSATNTASPTAPTAVSTSVAATNCRSSTMATPQNHDDQQRVLYDHTAPEDGL
jgi:hypothetical protein